MHRRLDLAGALANHPRVLFLDEPTTGLDAQSRRLLWDRIGELRDAGVAVVLTTQYLEEADQLADVVAILDMGEVVARGTPAELKARFGSATDWLGAERAAPGAVQLAVDEVADIRGARRICG